VNPFRYTARESDIETGLYYYRARYYDPIAARFTGEDSSRFRSGINFYAYVYNDPINFNDPTGLYALKGFSAPQQVDMMNAIAQVKKKLEECPSCVADPSLRDRLLGFIAEGNNGSGVTFIYKDKLEKGHCGDTRGITNTTYIADWKKNIGCSCLPSTIIHELVHQTWKNVFTPLMGGDPEKEPNSVDLKCFPSVRDCPF
jgi:RHS repeat-associated protein